MERFVKIRRFAGEAALLLAMALTVSWLVKG
jgi:hypothetical protein